MDIKVSKHSPKSSPNNPKPPNANVASICGDGDEMNKRRLEKNARKRERRQRAKEENPEKVFEESAKRQERRQRAKEENPEKVSEESTKRQERRQKAKQNNPETHKQFLDLEKQKRETAKGEILNDLFDSLFYENKHTFPTPVSKTLWEKLKKAELDFLFSPHFSPGEITVDYLHSYRQGQLDFLRNNLDFPHGGSVIFYIKTMVHRPKDQRIINESEIDYINSLILPVPEVNEDKSSKRREYYEKNKEKGIEQAKTFHESAKRCQKTQNLNLRFMKADPNKVLSIDDITINPFVSNFCQREVHKINLWKQDKNPEYLEKWKKQREDYERQVEELSIEYKENFLKNKWQEQS